MTKNEELPHATPGYWGARCCSHARQTGNPCKGPAMANGRCRMHGGKSTGPKNPHITLKHGRYTKEAIAQRKQVAAIVRRHKALMKEIEE